MIAQEALLDYRRQVAALYAEVRRPEQAVGERWQRFRARRDELFRSHPQSALTDEQKARFSSLSYFPYDPAYRFLVEIESDVEQEIIPIELPEDGLLKLQRVGRIHFTVAGEAVALSLFWLLGYGGGLFLPFRDRTNQESTYGGGRYLLDTIKHADLGHEQGKLVVDFNFAYNPSCAYHPRWHCPLAPHENWLPVAIPAGEKRFDDQD